MIASAYADSRNDIWKMSLIYLYNCISSRQSAFSSIADLRPPDEKLMRPIESHAGISEDQVNAWRDMIWCDMSMYRVDRLFNRLEGAFSWFIDTAVGQAYLKEYGRLIPMVGSIIEDK